ncbi:hypothetical protein T439DRAFT_351754 [Meredithblackwellia eburnea MCA 4105]
MSENSTTDKLTEPERSTAFAAALAAFPTPDPSVANKRFKTHLELIGTWFIIYRGLVDKSLHQQLEKTAIFRLANDLRSTPAGPLVDEWMLNRACDEGWSDFFPWAQKIVRLFEEDYLPRITVQGQVAKWQEICRSFKDSPLEPEDCKVLADKLSAVLFQGPLLLLKEDVEVFRPKMLFAFVEGVAGKLMLAGPPITRLELAIQMLRERGKSV